MTAPPGAVPSGAPKGASKEAPSVEGRRSALRLLVAGLLLGVALALLAHSYAPRYAAGMYATAPNAMVLPRVLLALWAGMAAVVLVAEWRAAPARPAGDLRPVLWLGGSLLLAAVALPHVGFAVMVTPLVGLSLVAMGERRPFVLLLATALLGPALWFLFHHVLLIRLPSILRGGLL